jgi:hypothetical protein
MHILNKRLRCVAVKHSSMRYPPNGILKASIVTCASQIGPGMVIRMGFPDLHKPHIKNYHFGVVTIVSMHSDSEGRDFPTVIRVHWGDDTFNDFCCFNSHDFSFDALVDCVNDFAVFRNGSLAGVDALQWSLIRKFESYVEAARPCSATFRFSSPSRRHPEIVMWHFAKNSTKNKMANIVSKHSRLVNIRKKELPSQKVTPVCRAISAANKKEESAQMRSTQLNTRHVRPMQAKDSTISFLVQVVSYVSNMKSSPSRLSHA